MKLIRIVLEILVQVEFVAEDEMVEIVPNMRMDSLHLICVCLLFMLNIWYLLKCKDGLVLNCCVFLVFSSC